MKVIIILSLLLIGTLCIDSVHEHLIRDMFSQWKLVHKKNYEYPSDDEHRFSIFVSNYIKILTINKQQSEVVLGLNQFADLTQEEFRKMSNNNMPLYRNSNNTKILHSNLKDLPSRIDWREKGAVTPVKNQGSCGSSWAYGAVGPLEAMNFAKTGKLISLSEQQIVDCDKKSSGCCGGLMNDAFDYVAKNGLESEADYPYVGVQKTCAADPSKSIRINSGHADIQKKNATALKAALAEQPVALAVQADQAVFQFYQAGVIMTLCGANVGHGIFAVGYDTFAGVEAFILKNTWGTGYGRNGYVLVSTNGSANNGAGVCGVLTYPSVPT